MNDAFLKSALTLILALTFLVFLTIVWGSSIKGGYIFDGSNFIFPRDFLNIWHNGLSAFFDDPGRYYNSDIYNQALDELVPGHNYKDQQFSHPPHFMLLVAPLGLMPFNVSWIVFTLFSIGLFWKFALEPLSKAERNILIWSPALMLALLVGQTSLILVAIFAGIMKTMDKRPLIAGILIALLTVKPQLGFLFPIFLLATGRYKAFFYASLCTAIFFALSVAIMGYDVWHTYLTSAAGDQAAVMINSHPIVLGLMPTLYVNLGFAGVPPNVALSLHGLAAILAIIVMIITVRKTTNPKIAYAIFIATSFVVTPYLMVYDTLIVIWAFILFASVFTYDGLDKITLYLLLALPIIGVTMALADLTGYAIAPWLVFLCITKHVWKTQPSVQSLA